MKKILTLETLRNALEAPVPATPGGNVRDYLCDLLLSLWREGEGVYAKKPFTRSQNELYEALANGGFIEKTRDSENVLTALNGAEADQLINQLIITMCYALGEQDHND